MILGDGGYNVIGKPLLDRKVTEVTAEKQVDTTAKRAKPDVFFAIKECGVDDVVR